jgi:hypothetical protein
LSFDARLERWPAGNGERLRMIAHLGFAKDCIALLLVGYPDSTRLFEEGPQSRRYPSSLVKSVTCSATTNNASVIASVTECCGRDVCS